jgi:hypothetical protein
MPEPPEPSIYQLRAVLLGIYPIMWKKIFGNSFNFTVSFTFSLDGCSIHSR